MEPAASARLVDWATARRLGTAVAGSGPSLARPDLARLVAEVGEVVREAESLVTEFTSLEIQGPPTRPWVMSRGEWIERNLRAFEAVLDPLAQRALRGRPPGLLDALRRKSMAAQVGGLLGYLGRRVLGQYDLFLPPDDRDLLYFVGPNLVDVERRFRFPPREFRLWLSLHEVTHRAQFDGVPWLRGYLMGLMDSYLESVELDLRTLLERLRKAREEVRTGDAWRGLGWLLLLMTPDQRETFRRMQAAMTLLEGHGNYVMSALSEDRVPSAPRMRRVLRQRRRGVGVNRFVQKAAGLEVKARQYDLGERFVAEVVARAGREGFGLVWERPENLPSLEEVRRPEAWVERVAAP